jgi:hypothetical protein
MPIQKLKITENHNYNETDYNQLSKDLFINIDKHYNKPPTCIEIKQKGELFRFGTFGNFSVIGGKGKARKTFFISALIGSALAGNKILNICSNFNDKKIVFFDTEQSEYDLYWSAKRAVQLNQASHHPDNYDIFCLRPLSPIERTAFIENYLEKNKDVGYIIIDGIRDLLTDINNPEQATEITTKLMQWTKVYNVHASVVLHENPGSDKLRGHLGTEVQNKAETVVSIEKPLDDTTVSRVIPKFIRGAKEFESFAFTINDKALPELISYDVGF